MHLFPNLNATGGFIEHVQQARMIKLCSQLTSIERDKDGNPPRSLNKLRPGWNADCAQHSTLSAAASVAVEGFEVDILQHHR